MTLPLDADNDLVEIAGRPERAAGTILHLGGRVRGSDGRPVRGAEIEIWQCDALGVYHHSRDRRGPADPNFQGFGRTTVAEDGAWRFRTIEPVPYPLEARKTRSSSAAWTRRSIAVTTEAYANRQRERARDDRGHRADGDRPAGRGDDHAEPA
jgi:Dioxygenase